MRCQFLLSAVLVVYSAAVAQAIPTITAGNHFLLPNTTGQTFDILISGGDPIPGVDLNLFIGGGISGPIITAVDLIGPGTIFNSNNTGQGALLNAPGREVGVTTTTTSGFVSASGIFGPRHL